MRVGLVSRDIWPTAPAGAATSDLTREQIEEIRRTAFPYSWFNPPCDMAARAERAEAELVICRRLLDSFAAALAGLPAAPAAPEED